MSDSESGSPLLSLLLNKSTNISAQAFSKLQALLPAGGHQAGKLCPDLLVNLSLARAHACSHAVSALCGLLSSWKRFWGDWATGWRAYQAEAAIRPRLWKFQLHDVSVIPCAFKRVAKYGHFLQHRRVKILVSVSHCTTFGVDRLGSAINWPIEELAIIRTRSLTLQFSAFLSCGLCKLMCVCLA